MLLSRENSSRPCFFAFLACTTLWPVGGAMLVPSVVAPSFPPPPSPGGGFRPPVTMPKNSSNPTCPSPSVSTIRIISSTSSSVTVSPILISTCRISAAPTKLFLSKSKAWNASQISSSVNFPDGSLGGSTWAGAAGTMAVASLPAGPVLFICAIWPLAASIAFAPGLSNFTFTLILPISLSALSRIGMSPWKLPIAIQSMIPTLALPINLSDPTCSLSNMSTSISFSVEIWNSNSWFHTGFLPPCTWGFVWFSWEPILSFAYGSAFPNMPCPVLMSTPLTTLTMRLPNLATAFPSGTACLMTEGGGGTMARWPTCPGGFGP
mmetsp:Transcript_15050/g.28019  ORF Transcript_15050/g.28019 Transcript_15050/m.28019 type:complete len:321 (-) Transcript_15050:559-1521(-)